MKHRFKGLSSSGSGLWGSSVAVLLALNPIDAVTGCLSLCSSWCLLNYNMSFPTAAGQAWFSPNSHIHTIKHFSMNSAHLTRLPNSSSWGCTVNGSPYIFRLVIYDPIDLGNRFCIFRWASVRFPCPLIDLLLQQQGCPLLQQLYLGVLCSLFDV